MHRLAGLTRVHCCVPGQEWSCLRAELASVAGSACSVQNSVPVRCIVTGVDLSYVRSRWSSPSTCPSRTSRMWSDTRTPASLHRRTDRQTDRQTQTQTQTQTHTRTRTRTHTHTHTQRHPPCKNAAAPKRCTHRCSPRRAQFFLPRPLMCSSKQRNFYPRSFSNRQACSENREDADRQLSNHDQENCTCNP